MKLNNRGIAITSVVYIILVLGILLILSTLGILSSRKLVLDKLKSDTYKELTKEEELVTTYYEDGKEVYFNVTTGKKCESSEVVSDVGRKEGCMKFYAFNDETEGKTSLNLILDHNTTDSVAWTDYETTTTEEGPIDLLDTLESDTESWVGVTKQEVYETQGLNARLLTVSDIANILNVSEDTIMGLNAYYQIPTTGYGWLNDRTSPNCTTYGCNNNSNVVTSGYWLGNVYSTSQALGLDYDAKIQAYDVHDSSYYGVRPVIVVEKAKLK